MFVANERCGLRFFFKLSTLDYMEQSRTLAVMEPSARCKTHSVPCGDQSSRIVARSVDVMRQLSGCLVRWSGCLVRWSAGPPVRWSADPLIRWSSGPLVPVRRSAGPLVRRPAGPLVR